MRDDAQLSADVFLPAPGGAWPAILLRTPYDNSAATHVEAGAFFASNGYAFVAQDVRGRGDSDGDFYPFFQEGPDGHDTIEWVASQPWCDGRVATMGGSYAGAAQWLAAAEGPPHLLAMATAASPGRWMEEAPYLFGTFSTHWLNFLNVTSGRTLQHPIHAPRPSLPDFPTLRGHRPLRDLPRALGRALPVWDEWLAHDCFDDYWRRLSLAGTFARLDLPVLHITGWFDYDSRGALYYWDGMKRSRAPERQWLVIGPWDHAGTRDPVQRLGALDFGPGSVVDLNDLHLRFFDAVVRGSSNAFESEPRVRTFAMGVNEWRLEPEWPPAVALRPVYLSSGGHANGNGEGGALTWEPPSAGAMSDRYVYDPDDPTPAYATVTDMDLAHRPLTVDFKLGRHDVLVYTSEPVSEPVHIAGTSLLKLFAESDRIDTDWHAQLCQVTADGRTDEVATASLRAAYRDGREASPAPIEPGALIEYTLEFTAIRNVWATGTRVRLLIASGDYPRRARNPNTNARTGDDAVSLPAVNSVHHGPAAVSRLLLPVVTG